MNGETLFQSRIGNIFFYNKSHTFFNEISTTKKMVRKLGVYVPRHLANVWAERSDRLNLKSSIDDIDSVI